MDAGDQRSRPDNGPDDGKARRDGESPPPDVELDPLGSYGVDQDVVKLRREGTTAVIKIYGVMELHHRGYYR